MYIATCLLPAVGDPIQQNLPRKVWIGGVNGESTALRMQVVCMGADASTLEQLWLKYKFHWRVWTVVQYHGGIKSVHWYCKGLDPFYIFASICAPLSLSPFLIVPSPLLFIVHHATMRKPFCCVHIFILTAVCCTIVALVDTVMAKATGYGLCRMSSCCPTAVLATCALLPLCPAAPLLSPFPTALLQSVPLPSLGQRPAVRRGRPPPPEVPPQVEVLAVQGRAPLLYQVHDNRGSSG